MNLVSCVAWVPRGVAAHNPEKLQLSPEELKCLVNETKELCGKEGINTDDVDEEFDEDDQVNLSKTETNADAIAAEDDFDTIYNLNSYDNDNDQNPVFTINDIATHVDNNDDEYISDHESEAELEEKEDFAIKESDNLLVVGHVEDESSVLEIYVYNHDEDAFYVHHDIVLASYPLTLEWLDFHPAAEKSGNYVAVGDMSQVIQIWDLDVVDVLEPDYVLGKVSKKKAKKMKKEELYVHSDAVLSLSWNKLVRNLMASGSADSTIVLWDLQEAKGVQQLSFHTNKVQALQWHPSESPFLLSGDTDGHLKLYDCRSPDGQSKSWTVNGEIERVAWNLQDSFKFFCSTDKGFIHMVDTRNSMPVHSFHAHKESVTGLDVSPLQPLTLISASMDRTLKLWDISDNFKMKKSYKLKVGSIYTTRAAPDLEMTIAVGGNYSSNNLKIIDVYKEMTDSASVEQHEDPTLKFEVKQEKDLYSENRGESSVQATTCKINKKFKIRKEFKRERE